MFSYKIITKDLYEHLQNYSGRSLNEIQSLAKRNAQLQEHIQKLNTSIKHALAQIEQKDTVILLKNQRLKVVESQLKKNQQNLKLYFEKQLSLLQRLNETVQNTNILKRQKYQLTQQYNRVELDSRNYCKILQDQMVKINRIEKDNQASMAQLLQLEEKIKLEKLEKQQLNLILNLKVVTVQNFNHQIINLRSNIQNKDQLIQKITSEYEVLKQEKLALDSQIQRFRNSPVAQLQQKLKTKQNWIFQLTKTINQLKQKNLYLQMARQNPSFQYPIKNIPPTNLVENNQYLQNLNKNTSQQAQRLKYLNICKQLLQQFNMKVKKIQLQKKGIQQKYQSIKLKLNQYQYKEFKYKDKLSLYLQKIERYQKLTQKQQSQMQKFIIQFDQQLNKIIRLKQDQIQQKVQYEVFKYQLEFQKLKQQEEKKLKLQENLKLQQQEFQKPKQQEQKYKQNKFNNKIYDIEQEDILSGQENIDWAEINEKNLKQEAKSAYVTQQNNQINQSLDDFKIQMMKQQLYLLKKQLHQAKKNLRKYQQSKRKYKKLTLKLQNQCQRFSMQTRRYKNLIQQLIKQLQIKSNQNQILKNNLYYNNSESSSGDRSNQFATSRLTHPQDNQQNLSTRLSGKNTRIHSGSDKYQYQISQVDVDLQTKNYFLLNKIKSPNHLIDKRDPAYPDNLSMQKKCFKNRKLDNNDSQISCSSSQGVNYSQSYQSSSNNSFESKNSYKSYGIKNLYNNELICRQHQYNRYLLHKNSLQ